MKESEKLSQAVTGTARSLAQQVVGGTPHPETKVDLAVIETVLQTWPSLPQNIARRMLEQYGAPNGHAQPDRLVPQWAMASDNRVS